MEEGRWHVVQGKGVHNSKREILSSNIHIKSRTGQIYLGIAICIFFLQGKSF